MKYPCKNCLVKPACTIQCKDYHNFIELMASVISPILMIISCLIVTGLMLYISLMNENYKLIWCIISASWLLWIIIQDEDSFFLTLISPLILPAFIAIKILAKIYRRV
jgi:hypothetical protein